jgi:hypothetical protein
LVTHGHFVQRTFSHFLRSHVGPNNDRFRFALAEYLAEDTPDAIILNAIGLTLGTGSAKKKRDPAFRQRVLKAYEYRDAVCGFDVRLCSVSIALDAAHIRWQQAGGPDDESNGLALCMLHHKTFDLGAFAVETGGRTSRVARPGSVQGRGEAPGLIAGGDR